MVRRKIIRTTGDLTKGWSSLGLKRRFLRKRTEATTTTAVATYAWLFTHVIALIKILEHEESILELTSW